MIIDRLYDTLPETARSAITRARMWAMQPVMRSHFRPFIHPGDLVFDLGANVGDYTQIFSDLGAAVVALEPQPSCLEALKTRFAGRPNVTVLPYGAGDASGTRPFFISTANQATSSFSRQFIEAGRYQYRTWDLTLEVPVITLDELVETYGLPNFCKVDVEGYEPQVLAGLHRALPCLSFEFTRESLEDTEACVRRLEQLAPAEDLFFNFTFFNLYRFALPQWVPGRALVKYLYNNKIPHFYGDVYAFYPRDR